MRGKWIPVSVGVVLFALAVGVVVWRGRRHPAPPPRAAATAAAIAVAQNEVTLQGKIRPRHVTSAGPAVSGFIEAFLVEPGADGIRKITAIHDGYRVVDLMSSSEKPHTIRLVLQFSNGLAFHNRNVSKPDYGFFLDRK